MGDGSCIEQRRSVTAAGVFFLLLLLVALRHLPLLTGEATLIAHHNGVSDALELNYPLRLLLSRSLKDGELPLWTETNLDGFPLFAEGEVGALYPPNLLLFATLPPLFAFHASLLLSLVLAGFFTFLLARELERSAAAALFAGIVQAFCGFLLVHLPHTSIVAASSLVPLLLWVIERFLRGRGSLTWAAPVIALEIFTGQPQMTLFSLVIATAYLMLRPAATRSPTGRSTRWMGSRVLLCRLRRWGGVVLLGVSLGAVQLLPTIELAAQSQRGHGHVDVTLGAWTPAHLVTLLAPYRYGNPAEGKPGRSFDETTVYLGILPLLLALYGIRRKERPLSGFLLGMALLALLLSSRLYALLAHLPPFGAFRFPSRFLAFFGLFVVLLSAFGFDRATEKCRGGRKGVSILFLLLALLDLWNFGRRYHGYIDAKAWFTPPRSVSILRRLSGGDADFRIWSLGVERSRHFAPALVKGWRGDLSPYLDHREVLKPFTNIPFGVPNAAGWFALQPIRSLRLYWHFERRDRFPEDLSAVSLSPADVRWLALLGVRFVTSFFPVSARDLEPEATLHFQSGMPPLRIYRNRLRYPPVRWVPHAEILPDEKGVVAASLSPAWDPERTVLVEEGDLDPFLRNFLGRTHPAGEEAEVRVLARSPGRITLEVSSPENGFLLLTQLFYPGWVARIESMRAPATSPETIVPYRADFLLTLLPLPAGDHHVTLTYRPVTFRLGLLLSLFALALCFTLPILPVGRRRNEIQGARTKEPHPLLPGEKPKERRKILQWLNSCATLSKVFMRAFHRSPLGRDAGATRAPQRGTPQKGIKRGTAITAHPTSRGKTPCPSPKGMS
ncbi:MAG: hypothetical protein D6795_07230 [Deltaproteobacteria bacterium]|nr:MAG: hypothetical protein D6795_07230 [Deltaproteobacteria bacterium]